MGKASEQISESLRLGALLAVAGGFFDAYTYLCRGGVFANAQTGNMVLFGIRMAEGRVPEAIAYLVPVGAFAAGVIAVELVRKRCGANRWLHWRQVIVLAELALVTAMAFLPQRLDMTVNIVISLVCAMQVEAFRKVHGSAFATTMCTGNLRSGTEQLVRWLQTGDNEALRSSGRYYAVIGCFILGAVSGALAVRQLGARALLLAGLPLLAAFGMMFLSGASAEQSQDRHRIDTE